MLTSKNIVWIALVFMLLFPASARASQPYDTFYVNQTSDGNYISWMQDVYTTGDTIVGMGPTAFNSPSDLFITSSDEVFVADTGNQRVVQLDAHGKYVREIGKEKGPGQLRAPEGVFVTNNGTIYVADTGNQRVVVYDSKGAFIKEMKKPNSPYLPKDFYFVPVKMVVDARDVLYVVSKGAYQGMVRIGKTGEFEGFFGGNKSTASVMDRLKRLLFTKDQLEKETAIRPLEVSNVTLGSEGFIYTDTKGVTSSQIKQLSAGGTDRFQNLKTVKFNDSDQIVDVAMDSKQFMYVLDQRLASRETRGLGMISIHSPGGTEMFRFGKTFKAPEQKGILAYPVSIGVNSRNELWVLDKTLNMIQVYERTPFGQTFLSAAYDYYIGDFERSKENWQKVLEQNELISLTYSGLGEVAIKEGRIEEAMTNFRITYDADGYSEAFWTYRMHWIDQDLIRTLAGLLALWLLYRYVLKRWLGVLLQRAPRFFRHIADELRDCVYTMFHPYEGFYRLKGRKISFWSLGTLTLLLFFTKLATIYWTGFSFFPTNLKAIAWGQEMIFLAAPVITWVVANYLISTIKDGEGRFREVLQGAIFAMVPYILFSIPILILSNILVLEEKILITMLTTIMWLWIGTLFIVKTQVTHNFEFIENIRNSVTTVFTIGIIWVFIAVGIGLTFNLWDFIYQLYKEVAFLG
ncbi:YIP1 family protein [Paenibacillus qinlingensis]|uniref:Yip1 domain-containing protein n=1 Tax=Paenibacillus qinlingensis TaxID=1837343 RepID=A0ABU1NNR8_9BACL|nr:YIP1 family protein [Paenibacillus qinlingensis]MDR6549115.1 hypothetical protein [Paenibacillus qinlingensis]